MATIGVFGKVAYIDMERGIVSYTWTTDIFYTR